jgi:hypothetical protein
MGLGQDGFSTLPLYSIHLQVNDHSETENSQSVVKWWHSILPKVSFLTCSHFISACHNFCLHHFMQEEKWCNNSSGRQSQLIVISCKLTVFILSNVDFFNPVHTDIASKFERSFFRSNSYIWKGLIFITHVKPLTKLKSITWIILSHSLQQS